jgi:hypothetical protein
MRTAYGKPQKVKGPIIQIDRNSSYPAVYRDFEGIPAGIPQQIKSMDESNTSAYYFILINVKSFKCKHDIDAFPMITETGPLYIDKTYFNVLCAHYRLSYDFITGLAFDSFNNKIAEVSRKLYTRRMQLKAQGCNTSQALIKRLLNSLWGKSIQRANPFYQVNVEANRVESFEAWNEQFLYSRSPGNNAFTYRLIKPLLIKWSMPQFAVSVLSKSRADMQEIVYKATDANVDVFMVNTDSLTMTEQGFNKLNELVPGGLISNELGGFSIEVKSDKFIAISSKRYVHTFADLTCRVRNSGKRLYGNIWELFKGWHRQSTEIQK